MRICIITSIHNDFDSRIWKHARCLADAGCEVHLVCPWNVDHAEESQVIFHTFPRVERRSRRPVLIPFRIFNALLPILKTADIVHFHDFDLLPWMALLALRKPVVYDVHENYPDEMLVKYWVPQPLKKPLYHMTFWGQSLLARIVKNIVLVTPYQKDQFPGGMLNKLYIYNYASTDLLKMYSKDYEARNDVVVFIGTQYENNGSLLFLEIAEIVLRLLPHVRFHMTDRFPDPSFRAKVKREIVRRRLDGSVFIIPYVPGHKIMSILNKATIAIVPNLRVEKQIKAIPTKIFEYMAAGLPIVSSDLPQQSEIMTQAKSGFLARPEDPRSFADAVVALIADRGLAGELGSNGQRAFREKYSWESQMPSLLKFYRNILECE